MKEFHNLIKSLVALRKENAMQTLQYYKPKVDRIITTKIQDRQTIEHTLDALCDVAYDEKVMMLFKKLCRYYYKIDPIATAQQIQFYRELWEDEEYQI